MRWWRWAAATFLPRRRTRLHRPGDRAVGRSPAEHQELGAVGVVDLQLPDVGGDSGDLVRPQAGHARVVLRLVADVAGLVLLLEPADHVLKALGPRQRPGAGQPLVAHVRPELARRGWARSRSPDRSAAGPPRRAGTTARTSWPGRCRRAGSPACGSGPRSGPTRRPPRSIGPGSRRRSPAAATRRGGRGSPSAGPRPRSWWASRSRDRPAGCRSPAAAAPGRRRGRSSPPSGPCPGRSSPSRRDGRRRRRRAPCSRRRSRPRPAPCGRRSACGARARAGARRRA